MAVTTFNRFQIQIARLAGILLLLLVPRLAFARSAEWSTEQLPEWLRREVLGISIWQFSGVLLLIFTALVLRRVVFVLVSSRIQRALGSKLPRLNEALAKAAPPVSGLLMALVFGLGFPFTGFPLAIDTIVDTAVRLIAVVSAVWLFYCQIDVVSDLLADRAARTDTKLDDQLVPLVRRTLKVFVVVIGGIFILQNFNIDVASLVAGLGLGGLAFALAAKDTIANLFGSIVIFVDRPFQIGDWVIIEGVEGMVEDVGFRTTRIRTFYNSLVTVPNAKMTQASIDNMGKRNFRRIKVVMGVTYSTTPAQMQAFVEGLRAIVSAHPATRKDYYEIHFNNFGAYSLDILFYVFVKVPSWSDELKARHELFLSAITLAEKLGVEFAFPTRTLHVDSFFGNAPRPVGGHPPKDPADMRAIVEQFGPNGSQNNQRFDLTDHGFRAGVHAFSGPSPE